MNQAMYRAFFLSLWIAAGTGLAAERPPVTRPRATSGDQVSQPSWQQRLTITVGPGNADLVGTDQKVIQAAVDYVARLGGGTVQLLPGTYTLRNAVFLASHVRLLGADQTTLLHDTPG
jgi:hypothetical protein